MLDPDNISTVSVSEFLYIGLTSRAIPVDSMALELNRLLNNSQGLQKLEYIAINAILGAIVGALFGLALTYSVIVVTDAKTESCVWAGFGFIGGAALGLCRALT